MGDKFWTKLGEVNKVQIIANRSQLTPSEFQKDKGCVIETPTVNEHQKATDPDPDSTTAVGNK